MDIYLYARKVRPVLSYPDQHYEPKHKLLEPEGIWHSEDDIPLLMEKYKHLENPPFESIVFEEKYESVRI